MQKEWQTVDPDQTTAASGVIWSGSTLFAQTCLSENLGLFRYLTLEPPHDKTNKVAVCPAKTQINLGIRPVWSESSLSAQWVAKDPSFLHADSEDSDQTGQMPRLIWVFAGHTCHFVGFVTRRLTFWINANNWITAILLSLFSRKDFKFNFNIHFQSVNYGTVLCSFNDEQESLHK